MRARAHRKERFRKRVSGTLSRISGQVIFLGAISSLTVFLTGCRGEAERETSTGIPVLQAWVHSGQENEREVVQDQVDRFNREQSDVQIDLTLIPEGGYNAQVQAAALADDLPDLLEFDGPFVYSYVWQGHLLPLEGLLAPSVRSNLIASIVEQGTYRGELYSVGTFDSGLALFARRDLLESVGARIPASPAEAWSASEFADVLESLSQQDQDGQVLDLKLNYTGEWFTYAFLPLLHSAGNGWAESSAGEMTDAVFNGPEAVAAMEEVQEWITRGFVDPNLDDHAFLGDRVAISWGGHWDYQRYSEAHGEDLVIIPLPDFGEGSKTGQGSWNWGITTNCSYPELAAQFLEFLLMDENVLAMTSANGAIPATQSAISQSSLHREKGPLHLYVEQLIGGYSVPRPRTPAYPVITEAFQKAFDDIRHGGDVQESLDQLAADVRRDLQDNEGYPPVDQ